MTILMDALVKRKRNLAPEELQSRLAGGDGPQLVDVREQVEYAGGRIAGARLLPLNELDRRAAELDRRRAVVCVCRSGKRSAEAVEKLTALGFTRVEELDGGMRAWEQAGLPIEKDAHAPWALERQVRLAAGLLVLAGLGLSLIWPAAIGLSWLVGAGLVFAAATDWCGMGLLLAKMPWNKSPDRNSAACCSAAESK